MDLCCISSQFLVQFLSRQKGFLYPTDASTNPFSFVPPLRLEIDDFNMVNHRLLRFVKTYISGVQISLPSTVPTQTLDSTLRWTLKGLLADLVIGQATTRCHFASSWSHTRVSTFANPCHIFSLNFCLYFFHFFSSFLLLDSHPNPNLPSSCAPINVAMLTRPLHHCLMSQHSHVSPRPFPL